MSAPLKQRDQRGSLPGYWQDLSQQVLASVDGPWLALAVYGSQARGTARKDSDVDVLQVVAARPRTYTSGRFNVSAYHPQTLTTMARRGSLFVLHLSIDSVPVDDSGGVLEDILREYVTPATYDPLLREVAAAGAALRPTEDTTFYFSGLRRLGIYLVRTAAYAILADRGTPTFEIDDVARQIGSPAVAAALGLRLTEPGAEDLDKLLVALTELVESVPRNELGSVEALAIAYLDRWPYAAALLTHVLIGDDAGFEYTALTPPPM